MRFSAALYAKRYTVCIILQHSTPRLGIPQYPCTIAAVLVLQAFLTIFPKRARIGTILGTYNKVSTTFLRRSMRQQGNRNDIEIFTVR